MKKEYTVSMEVHGFLVLRIKADDTESAQATAENLFHIMSKEEVARRSDLTGRVFCVSDGNETIYTSDDE